MEEFKDFVQEYSDQVEVALQTVKKETLEGALDVLKEARSTGKNVWLVGNGGSASLASHMATDLQLAGLRAQALVDIAAVTTYANDLRYGDCFRQQLSCLARGGDVLIAISTSGNSENICNAVFGFGKQGKIISLVGKGGGELHNTLITHVDVEFLINSQHTGVVQDVHQSILHMLTYWLMKTWEK